MPAKQVLARHQQANRAHETTASPEALRFWLAKMSAGLHAAVVVRDLQERGGDMARAHSLQRHGDEAARLGVWAQGTQRRVVEQLEGPAPPQTPTSAQQRIADHAVWFGTARPHAVPEAEGERPLASVRARADKGAVRHHARLKTDTLHVAEQLQRSGPVGLFLASADGRVVRDSVHLHGGYSELPEDAQRCPTAPAFFASADRSVEGDGVQR
mmetsp:Transcript_42173/g.116430  ORF Transcript_42173/g.116430 Transcript_42173/m.116430 type:complete len:213 (-) Transcript_42173:304-942(-)